MKEQNSGIALLLFITQQFKDYVVLVFKTRAKFFGTKLFEIFLRFILCIFEFI
ncbi:hypothetical protein [Gelidibacter salicanalis]|uniref:Uncharacterized protein n=1 Tax=Gelidibacter salicanalis TaxID=291193 RepID=A0A934KT91_9FLAO|nr:hypothetical protein [Gelidibacter salicanalis]MBJ7880946.1 hypothetical protein [Gelidibacter salicanalis]